MRDQNPAYIDKEGFKRFNYRKNRDLAIELLGGKCVVCGSTQQLEIDHIDRATKSFDLGDWLSVCTPAELKEELAKCQLLCHPHHMEKSIRERGQTPAAGRHGLSSYKFCKCSICTKAHADYCKEYRRKKKQEKNT